MRIPLSDPFWIRVKALIKAQKTSQEKLAAQINVSYSTLKFWMCYGLLPSVGVALDISDALDVSIEFLVRGKDSISSKTSKIAANKRKMTAMAIRKMAMKIEEQAKRIG
jgi:transcriptional regulator with XRE-family HTH domain